MIGAVNDASRPQDVVVCAAGAMPGDLHKLWRTRDPKGYHVEYGYSCMGYEIAGGLGVKLAAPEREVYVIVGDGSYLMLSSELVTAVAERQKLTIVLVDNRGYKSIGNLSRSLGMDGFGTLYRYRPNGALGVDSEESTDYLPVDLAANAESLGAKVIRAATDRGAAGRRSRRRRRSTGPVVIAVEVDRYEDVPGYESWWDVAVAEVSEVASVRAAREQLRGRARGRAEPRVIDAVVMGRVGIDLYPNEHETPLSEVRTFTRFVGGFAGNVATGLARLGVRRGDRLARRRRGPRRVRARTGSPARASTSRFLATDPYWLTPPTFCEVWPPDRFPLTFYRQADRAGLAALAGGLRRGGGRRGAAPLRDGHRPRAVAVAARRRSRRCARTAARRSSTSTGARRSGTTRASIRRVAAEAAAAADIVIGNEEEVEAAQRRGADARAQARRARRDGLRATARRPTCPASRSRS